MAVTHPRATDRFSVDEQKILRSVAWASIDAGLSGRGPWIPDPAEYPSILAAPGACFVTLKLNGQLRGCIGTLEARRPLLVDVAHNAYAAAFSDPRFPPLTQAERASLELDISVLTPAEPMQCRDQAELLQQLVPEQDGLIIADGPHRATFLPSVWESLPNAEDFVAHLKLKAGLPVNYWSPSLEIWRYRTESF